MRFLALDTSGVNCETLVIGGKNSRSLVQRKGNALHLYFKAGGRFTSITEVNWVMAGSNSLQEERRKG